MTKRDLSLLKERVKARLADLDMSPAEAARRGQLPKDFIYDLLNDRKKTVRSDNLANLARALDCDYSYLEGLQPIVSVVDNIVDFDRPPVPIVGDAAVGVWLEEGFKYNKNVSAPDMPNLPPDTRFDMYSQVDLFVKGNHLSRFAPHGYILRCVLVEKWPELFRDGDLVVIDRFKNNLFERAAWRLGGSKEHIEWTSDSLDKKSQISWRSSLEGEYDGGTSRPYAMVIFAYAEPRIRRMF